jgi:hypothetical protein
MAGKVGHVPAPYVVLLDGTKIKCQMTIENGLLVIEIPMDVYLSWNWDIALPLDPAFGYTTAGGTELTGWTGAYVGISAAPASSGSMTSISCHYYSAWGSYHYVFGVYNAGTLMRQTAAIIGTLSKDWHTNNLASAVDVVGSTTYALIIHFETGNEPRLYYDTVTGSDIMYYEKGSYSATLDANITLAAGWNNSKLSIYGTYTESGGTSSIKKRNTVAVAGIKKDKTVAIANIKKIDTVANS